MRKWVHSIMVSGACLVVLTQFNNCDQYSENPLFSKQLASCLEGQGEQCERLSTDLLEIRMTSSEGQIVVGENEPAVTLAGACNEGGYPLNGIQWTIYKNGSPEPAGSNQVTYLKTRHGTNPSCKKGRFEVYASLSNSDGVFLTSGAYEAEIKIIGFDKMGQPYENSNFGAHKLEVYVEPN